MAGVQGLSVSIFQTPLGWFALLGSDSGLQRVSFGHEDQNDARCAVVENQLDISERDWSPILRKQCESFAAGRPTKFARLKIVRGRALTPFQQRVVDVVQSIPPGQTLTYGQVAELAGSPGAARAVGQVMAKNPVPLVVPCHRVVGSAGGLGGFSAPGGVETKKRLLALEMQLASARSRSDYQRPRAIGSRS